METCLEKVMLPFKMQQLLDIIIEKKNFSVKDALQYLYSSDLYKQLSSESSSLWQFSSLSLYDLLKKEKRVKRQNQRIDSSILLFYIFCLENYKEDKQITSEETLFLFNKYRVIEFLGEVYESLHTQGREYIIEEIDLYISNQK